MPNKPDAILIDSREPSWVQALKFGGIPTMVTMMDAGDVQIVCSDGAIITVERKTPDDLLGTLAADRLFPQCARLVQPRLDDQAIGRPVYNWPYLVITGPITPGPGGKAVTERLTNWDYAAIQGALLVVQEMGVFVQYCASDADFEACVLRLAHRERGELVLLPPRVPNVVGPGAAFLAGLPGIGIERVMQLLTWSGGNVAHVLSAITELDVDLPIVPMSTRRKIRQMLGLKEGQTLAAPYFDAAEREVLHIDETIPF